MDRYTFESILYGGFLAAVVGTWIWKATRLRAAKRWPQTEGTVESGAFEVVEQVKFGKIVLPVFAFSYQVSGEYYSGRFSLLPYSNDVGDSIIKMIVGRKLPIKYNPLHPDEWFLPEKLMEGYKVEQKTGPHLQHFYPSD
jgi:hypothetical protein